MEWIVAVLAILLIGVCMIGIAFVGRNDSSQAHRQHGVTPPAVSRRPSRKGGADQALKREQEKQAHYMRNFWNYDGSEQQDWEDE